MMRALLVSLALTSLAGCGFHLRGADAVEFPPSLQHLRVTMTDRMAYPPLLVEMRNALRTRAGVTLEESTAKAPQLDLSGETFISEPLVSVVETNVKASGYVLSYKVAFNLKDAAGKELVPTQSVKVQREYDFDPNNIVAKEKEEEFLRSEMQRDAVQQIIRRLAAIEH